MKIHVYLLCYNEERILPFSLMHYEKFCSKIFILDNQSTDKSVEIARAHPLVKVIHWDSDGKLSDKKHIELKESTYKEYSRKGGKYTEEIADWIICVDMDELIYHPNLINILKRYKKNGVTVPKIRGFNMSSPTWPDYNAPIISQIRNGVRAKHMDKRAIFQASFDIKYSAGCHPVGEGYEAMKRQPFFKESAYNELILLHYKHIADNYSKMAVRNGSRLSSDNLKNKWGTHYLVDKNILEAQEKRVQKLARPVLDEEGNIIY